MLIKLLFYLSGIIIISPQVFSFNECNNHTMVNSEVLFKKIINLHKNNLPILKEFNFKIKKQESFNDLYNNLNENSKVARFYKFNQQFCDLDKQYMLLNETLEKNKNNLANIPISQIDQRIELQSKIKQLEKNQQMIFKSKILTSYQAYSSVILAFRTIATKKTAAPKEQDLSQIIKKMPKRFGGSKMQRDQVSADSKKFLLPTDDEFGSTQIGEKYLNDSGGSPRFFSLDYDNNELYLSNDGDKIYKLKVSESNGETYVETKGQDILGDFYESIGNAKKIDFNKKDDPTVYGSFLTKDKSKQSWFGDFIKSGPKILNEDTQEEEIHYEGDGHHH